MHKRLFSFGFLFLLCFGLAIANNFLSHPTTSLVAASLPSTDSMLQLLLNPDLALETNSWMGQLANEWVKPSMTPIANLNFNQIVDQAIAPPLSSDIVSEILRKG